MINGVLVERTVKDVTPALQTNSEGLKKVLEELVKQYKRQQEEMEKWKVSQKKPGITLMPRYMGSRIIASTCVIWITDMKGCHRRKTMCKSCSNSRARRTSSNRDDEAKTLRKWQQYE